jgi:hypothetical protein
MTVKKSERMVAPVRAAFKALMRSEDSPALAANLRWLWDVFMVRPSGEVNQKFWPDAKGRLPGGADPTLPAAAPRRRPA